MLIYSRNSVLMNLDIGERSGSEIPNIFSIWREPKWERPQIEERLDGVERTVLSLSLKKQPIKTIR